MRAWLLTRTQHTLFYSHASDKANHRQHGRRPAAAARHPSVSQGPGGAYILQRPPLPDAHSSGPGPKTDIRRVADRSWQSAGQHHPPASNDLAPNQADPKPRLSAPFRLTRHCRRVLQPTTQTPPSCPASLAHASSSQALIRPPTGCPLLPPPPTQRLASACRD